MSTKENKIINYLCKDGNSAPVKYLAISAHHDDVEIMATDGIIKGQGPSGSFFAVIVTDGRGSARSGPYANYTDEEMAKVRIVEQEKAAEIGHYHGLRFLNYTSVDAKKKVNDDIVNDIMDVIRELKPEVIYTHNICDKHPTHIGTVLKVIEAIRRLPEAERPRTLYGCEVWRSLDWMMDDEKVLFDLTSGIDMTDKQLKAFDSQVAGGKSYDLATAGRRYANATYAESHSVDTVKAMGYAMDLTPLIKDTKLSVLDFALTKIDAFKRDVIEKLS